MTDEIKVNFEAKNPSGIKFLTQLYDKHLVLNDIGVRMDDQITKKEELTVPNATDMKNINQIFVETVQTFTKITKSYGNVDDFVANFSGITKEFAQKLILEMSEFNDGISAISSTEGGVAAYDDDKLNNWVNSLMGHIVETNESFNKLINQK